MADTPGEDSSYEFAPNEISKPRDAETQKQSAHTEQLQERNCPHCGFRIYGKPRQGRCPECAAPLDLTATDLLQFSSTGWVRGLTLGMFWLALGVGGQAAAVFFAWGLSPKIGDGIHLAAACATIIGTWIITQPEPGIGTAKTSFATSSRGLSLVVATLWGVNLAAMIMHKPYFEHCFMYLTLLAMAAQAMYLGAHLRIVATRIPSDSLATQSFNMGWLFAIMCVFFIILQYFGIANVGYLQFFFCSFPMVGGLIAIILWAMVTLIRMGFEIWQCAVTASVIAEKKAARAAGQKK